MKLSIEFLAYCWALCVGTYLLFLSDFSYIFHFFRWLRMENGFWWPKAKWTHHKVALCHSRKDKGQPNVKWRASSVGKKRQTQPLRHRWGPLCVRLGTRFSTRLLRTKTIEAPFSRGAFYGLDGYSDSSRPRWCGQTIGNDQDQMVSHQVKFDSF